MNKNDYDYKQNQWHGWKDFLWLIFLLEIAVMWWIYTGGI